MIELLGSDVRVLAGFPASVTDEQLAPHIEGAVQRVMAHLRGTLPRSKADVARVKVAASCFAIANALPVLNTFYLSRAKDVPRTVATTDYVFHEPNELLKLVAYWERRGYDALRDVGRTGGSVGVAVI